MPALMKMIECVNDGKSPFRAARTFFFFFKVSSKDTNVVENNNNKITLALKY